MSEVETIEENGHKFVDAGKLGIKSLKAKVCELCGTVRNGQNKPCRGKVRVALRNGDGKSDGA